MPALIRTSMEPQYCPIIRFEPDWSLGNVGPLYGDVPEQYPAGRLPKRAVQISNHKAIPDVLILAGAWLISEPVRELIEGFEPGVHRFHPMPLTTISGAKAEPPRFVLDIRNAIDPIIVEASRGQIDEWGDIDVRSGEDLVLDESQVRGLHVWRGRKQRMIDVFFSDDLVAAIQRAKLKKIRVEFTRLGRRA